MFKVTFFSSKTQAGLGILDFFQKKVCFLKQKSLKTMLLGAIWVFSVFFMPFNAFANDLTAENSKNAKIPSPAMQNPLLSAQLSQTLPREKRDKALLAWQAYQNKDFVLATQYFDEVGGFWGLFNAGEASYRNKDLESAVYYFREALLSAPTDLAKAQTLFNLGNSYFKAKLFPLAIEAYQGALHYQRPYPKAQHNLQLALWMLRQQKKGKKEKGAGGGKNNQQSEGAFYGGQKPSKNNEPGKGSQGDAPEGEKSGRDFVPPPEEKQTDYQLKSSPTLFSMTADTEAGQAILAQQAQAQTLSQLAQKLNQVSDQQAGLLQRLFEREEGYEALQHKKHALPGVQPW